MSPVLPPAQPSRPSLLSLLAPPVPLRQPSQPHADTPAFPPARPLLPRLLSHSPLSSREAPLPPTRCPPAQPPCPARFSPWLCPLLGSGANAFVGVSLLSSRGLWFRPPCHHAVLGACHAAGAHIKHMGVRLGKGRGGSVAAAVHWTVRRGQASSQVSQASEPWVLGWRLALPCLFSPPSGETLHHTAVSRGPICWAGLRDLVGRRGRHSEANYISPSRCSPGSRGASSRASTLLPEKRGQDGGWW